MDRDGPCWPYCSSRYLAWRCWVVSPIADRATASSPGRRWQRPPAGTRSWNLESNVIPPEASRARPARRRAPFLACSADCTCPATVLDHFQCYEVKPAFFAQVDGHGAGSVRHAHRDTALSAPPVRSGEQERRGHSGSDRSPRRLPHQGRLCFTKRTAPDPRGSVRNPAARRRSSRCPDGADQQGRRPATAAARPLPVLQGEAVEGRTEVREAHRDRVGSVRDA